MKSIIYAAIILIYGASIASAHSAKLGFDFTTGLLHPVVGLDHFLAMLSVGIISAQIGKKAIWMVPLTFVLMMVVGGLMGLQRVPISGVEYVISISVMILGLAVAAMRNMPIAITMIFVGFFGVFHGYVHGVEIPAGASEVSFSLGFVLGTLLIHLSGVAIALVAKFDSKSNLLLRFLGAVFMGMGLEMILLADKIC